MKIIQSIIVLLIAIATLVNAWNTRLVNERINEMNDRYQIYQDEFINSCTDEHPCVIHLLNKTP